MPKKRPSIKVRKGVTKGTDKKTTKQCAPNTVYSAHTLERINGEQFLPFAHAA